jgi:hypothetical protein
VSELKPCPWCNAPAVLSVGVSSQYHTIYCSGPDECVSMGGANEGDLVSYWNTRAPDWQDISTAPRDGTEIILFHPVAGVCAGFCPAPGFAWHVMDGSNTSVGRKSGRSVPTLTSFTHKPTHWMPLPAPPKEVG